MARHLNLQTWILVVEVWRALEFQGGKDAVHRLQAQIHPKTALHLSGTQGNTAWRRWLWISIGKLGTHGATTQLFHQTTRAHQGREGQGAIHAAPETLPCF